MSIRLDQLPPIDVIEQKTPDQVLEEIGGKDTSAADPLGRGYRAAASYGVRRRAAEDANAKAFLLPFATGKNLDYIGETYYRNADGSPVLRKQGESDEDYRLALQESPEGLTSAGTKKSYEYHAWRSHDSLKKTSVSYNSPEPMESDIWFISTDELEIEVKQAITDRLDTFAPGGDVISVKRATSTPIVITAKVICDKGAGVSIIKDSGLKALDEYLKKSGVIRGVVSDSWVKDCLTMPGVIDIESDFKTVKLEPGKYAEFTLNITYEVVL